MMGVQGARPEMTDEMILPIEAVGVRLISIGFLIDPQAAVVWRGPMVHGVVTQFLQQVDLGRAGLPGRGPSAGYG